MPRFGQWLLILSTVARLAAADPPWKTPGACLTPAGTLCRTLEYEVTGWDNLSWGFHAIERYTSRRTAALRSDGAKILRIAHRSYRWHVIPSESYDRVRIILPAKQQTFEVEHRLREFRDLGGVWWLIEHWTADDPDCGKRATMAGESRRKTGNEPVLSGIRSIEYLYESEDHRAVQRIAFAPYLGCSAIAFNLTRRNQAGWRISEFELKLVTASLGEPDSRLFEVPAGYLFTPPEKSWPYVWMGSLPGEITSTSFSPIVP